MSRLHLLLETLFILAALWAYLQICSTIGEWFKELNDDE